jgi:hypothetical protein
MKQNTDKKKKIQNILKMAGYELKRSSKHLVYQSSKTGEFFILPNHNKQCKTIMKKVNVILKEHTQHAK